MFPDLPNRDARQGMTRESVDISGGGSTRWSIRLTNGRGSRWKQWTVLLSMRTVVNRKDAGCSRNKLARVVLPLPSLLRILTVRCHASVNTQVETLIACWDFYRTSQLLFPHLCSAELHMSLVITVSCAHHQDVQAFIKYPES